MYDYPSTISRVIMTDKQKCMYKAVRKPGVDCDQKATTDWGFCSKHSRTVQAKRAKDAYDLEHAVKEEPEPVEEVVEEEHVEEPVLAQQDVKKKASVKRQPTVAVKKSKASVQKQPTAVVKKSKAPVQKQPVKKSPTLKAETSRIKTQLAPPVAKRSTGAQSKTSVINKGGKKTVKRTILRNYWGNFEDSETGIVFNAEEKCAIGVQHESGRIMPLRDVHIEICKRLRWNYTVPKRVTVVPTFSSSSEESDEEEDELDGEEEDLEEEELEEDEEEEELDDEEDLEEDEEESEESEELEDDEEEEELEDDEEDDLEDEEEGSDYDW